MRFPTPGELFRLPVAAVSATIAAVEAVPRLVALVGEIETLVRRVNIIVERAEKVSGRADAVVDDVVALQVRVHSLVGDVSEVVTATWGQLDRVRSLVELYQPLLVDLRPMVGRIVETTSNVEVDSIMKLIDVMPAIADKLDSDILPVIDTLATVAPDLRDLLDVSRVMNELLGAVPGLGRIKKKVEKDQAEQDETVAYRAGEEPAAAPERRSLEADDPAPAESS